MSHLRTNLDMPAARISLMRPGPAGSWAASLAPGQGFVYLLIGVCGVVLLVHLPALSCRATFHDDRAYVLENPLVQDRSWESVKRFFCEVGKPSTVRGYYQPLTMTSLMLDRLLSGRHESLRAYHCTNLLLHLANTALVAVLLYLLFGRAVVAGVVALLFGLHPISVESVCWIAERKTVLASFFALGSLIAYVRFTREPKARFYVACFVAYLLAVLAKPITVPLPALMLLMDYWPLDRLGRRSVLEKLPLFALAAVFSVITYVSQSRTTPVFLPGDYNPWHVPLILCHNIIFYLSKALYPVHLSAHYGYMTRSAMLAGVIGTSLLLPLLLASCKWTRALVTGWLMFFVMILPAMSIISVTPVTAANRYLYLPSLGFLLIAAWLLARVSDWLGVQPRSWAHVPGAVALLVVCAAETVATRAYAAHWQDSIGLHEYLLTITPGSAILHSDLGAALAAAGRTGEALDHYRQAVQIEPRNALAHFNLGAELAKSEDTAKEAIAHYRQALETDSGFLNAHVNLVGALLAQGDVNEAIHHGEKAVEMNRAHVLVQYNLGKALLIGGRASEGLAHLRAALRLNPSFLLAARDLAWTLATHPDASTRDPNEALSLAQRAMAATQGRDVRVLDTLAAAYAANAQYGRAAETAEKALAMANRMRHPDLASEIEERLKLYELGCPYYENPRVPLDRILAQKSHPEHAPEAARLATRVKKSEVSDEAKALGSE